MTQYLGIFTRGRTLVTQANGNYPCSEKHPDTLLNHVLKLGSDQTVTYGIAWAQPFPEGNPNCVKCCNEMLLLKCLCNSKGFVVVSSSPVGDKVHQQSIQWTRRNFFRLYHRSNQMQVHIQYASMCSIGWYRLLQQQCTPITREVTYYTV